MSEIKPGLDVLNTGYGHVEINFDKGDAIEVERAKRMITDMIRRGFVLFLENTQGQIVRATGFDASSGHYFVGDVPSEPFDIPLIEPSKSESPQPAEKRKPGRPRKVPMEGVRATAIGRSAGG